MRFFTRVCPRHVSATAHIGFLLLLIGLTNSARAQFDSSGIDNAGRMAREAGEKLLEEATTFSISGNLTITADLYEYETTPDSAQPARRPKSLYRFLFTPVIKIGENISLPLNLMLHTPETNFNTPTAPTPTLAQIFQNPANSFGLSSFMPKFDWAEFKLGSHTPQYSNLSIGDQQLFGAGVDLKPGKFQIAASEGVSQRAVESDSVKNLPGAYRRDIYSARIGYGKKEESGVAINMVYAKDALNSLRDQIREILPSHPASDDSLVVVPPDSVRLKAEEGVVVSSDVRIKLAESLTWNMEGAISSFTRDQTSPEKVIEGNPFASLFKTRTSTKTDFAGSTDLTFKASGDSGGIPWGVKLRGLYMGAGFVPVGYSYVQSDRLEFAIEPNFQLFDKKLQFTGSIGERINNLQKTKGATETQLIGSADLNADITDAFSIAARYSNFGIRNDQSSDTLKVQTVSQSLSIDPSLRIDGEDMSHIISGSLALDKYDDFNVLTTETASNDTRSALASYTIALNAIPLTFNVMGTYLENDLPGGSLVMRGVGSALGYSFLEGAIVPNVSVTLSSSNTAADPTDTQLFFKAGSRFRVAKFLELQAVLTNNSFDYGNPLRRGKQFKETILELGLMSRF